MYVAKVCSRVYSKKIVSRVNGLCALDILV
jgi:hypothetical protein